MARRMIGLGLLLLGLSPVLSAQVSSVSIQQNLTSATCPGSGCVVLAVSGYGGVAMQITGTYSGTVSFEGSVDGVTFTALNLTPTNSTTAASSTTSTGVWSGGMGGLTSVRARMSSYTSGTASVVVQAAPTAARNSSGGGGSTITCADTGVLFADGANNPACDAGLTYAKSTDILTVAGGLSLGSAPAASGTLRLSNNATMKVLAEDGTTTSQFLAIQSSNDMARPVLKVGDQGNNTRAFSSVILRGPNGLEVEFDYADGVAAAGHEAGFFGFQNSSTANFNTGVLLFGRRLTETAADQTWFGDSVNPVFITGGEGSEPAAPAANRFIIFSQDVGGKTSLCARFNSGASQCFAAEP